MKPPHRFTREQRQLQILLVLSLVLALSLGVASAWGWQPASQWQIAFGGLALAVGWNLCAFGTDYAHHAPPWHSRWYFVIAGVWALLVGSLLILSGSGSCRPAEMVDCGPAARPMLMIARVSPSDQTANTAQG